MRLSDDLISINNRKVNLFYTPALANILTLPSLRFSIGHGQFTQWKIHGHTDCNP